MERRLTRRHTLWSRPPCALRRRRWPPSWRCTPLVWTALPTLLYPNLPLDLIEALIYGREWQLGYDKLPPLPWWLVEIAYRLVGHDFAYYLLAQIAVVARSAIVWLTARPLAGPLGALVAVLIVDGLHYLNYTSAKFNHDVDPTAVLGAGRLCLPSRACAAGGSRDWLLLGVAVGVSLWAKYFVVVLAAPLALFVLVDPRSAQLPEDARALCRRGRRAGRSWRRISSGWCRTISCLSPMPNTAPLPSRGWSTISGTRCNSRSASCSS